MAPENTLDAFRLAWKQGADGIESDWRLTRDGALVCNHDPGTGRMAGVDKTVASLSLEELKRIDVGVAHSFRYMGRRVPTWAEVWETVPPGKLFLAEVKAGVPCVEALAREAVALPAAARAGLAILAFEPEVVAAARRLLPDCPAVWLTEFAVSAVGELTPSPAAVLAVLEQTGATALGSQAHPRLDAAFLDAVRSAGRQVHVWTVDDAAEAARYARLGVTSLITNRPGDLRRELRQALLAEAGSTGKGSVLP